MTKCPVAALMLFAVSPGLVVAEAGAPRPVALEDFEQIKTPDGPHLSRDGRQIAYVVDDRVYVVPAAGGEACAVTSAGLRVKFSVGAWREELEDVIEELPETVRNAGLVQP